MVLRGSSRHVICVDHQAAALDIEDPKPVDLTRCLLIKVNRLTESQRGSGSLPVKVSNKVSEILLRLHRALERSNHSGAA